MSYVSFLSNSIRLIVDEEMFLQIEGDGTTLFGTSCEGS